jgi:rhodanese-related sulfurtransferase
MKKLMHLFMVALIIPAIMITGCKDDNPEPAETGNYETLVNYMAANNLDLPTLLSTPSSWVVSPELISKSTNGIVDPADYSIPGYHVFDIRSAEAFNAGHIKNSINVTLANVLEKAAEVGKDKPILIVCVTGQTAGRAVMALRLAGFEDAQVMKFGFSYWNSDFDSWTGNCSDQADESPNWVTTDSPSLPSNDLPAWTSSTTDGAQLLAERISIMLSAGGWGVDSDVVLSAPADHNIYNFWDEATYKSIGHYDGAFLFPTISFETVNGLPQSEDCLIYCYTGQTSSFATAWLQVLGYQAKSIKFGVNSLRHQALDDAGKPAWHHSKDYPYVTTTK